MADPTKSVRRRMAQPTCKRCRQEIFWHPSLSIWANAYGRGCTPKGCVR